MAKTALDLINIMRNVTGRVDASDPLFTDQIMLGYLNDFIQLESTMDVRIFKNRTWYSFNYGSDDVNPFPVNLQTLLLDNQIGLPTQIGASTIGPEAYADGFVVFWYEDPATFYQIWPETQAYQPQRPTYVLYYNNSLTFRGPPDKTYLIKIAAYQVEYALTTTDQALNQDYVWRYFAYGAALDIFSDYGEMDKYNEIFPVFRRYRSLVYSRTNSQYQNQRPNPEF